MTRAGDGSGRRQGRAACTVEHDPATPRQEREAAFAMEAREGGTEGPIEMHPRSTRAGSGAIRVARSRTLIREVRESIRAPSFPGPIFGGYGSNLRPHRERKDPLPRYESSPRHVIEARYLGDYKVWLEFNDGRKGVVDLADELHGDEHSPLRNRELFSNFYLDYGLASIAWLDGADFPPEFLYEKLKAMN